MKILYLSDSYTENVFGTKVSLYKELCSRRIDVVWSNIHSAGTNTIDGKWLLQQLRDGHFTDLWVVHSWVRFNNIRRDELKDLGIKVLGFGFSDPYRWKPEKLSWYDAYATNHYDTYLSLQKHMPVCYFPTACDTRFHINLNYRKTADIIMFGAGIYPEFSPETYRIDMLRSIIKNCSGIKIMTFGIGWGDLPCRGELYGKNFIAEINHAELSLDLQQKHAPLAHRIFESLACGTLIITRDRPEVRTILGADNSELYYHELSDLQEKIKFLLRNTSYRQKLAQQLYTYVRTNHNISNRVDNLFAFLRSIQ